MYDSPAVGVKINTQKWWSENIRIRNFTPSTFTFLVWFVRFPLRVFQTLPSDWNASVGVFTKTKTWFRVSSFQKELMFSYKSFAAERYMTRAILGSQQDDSCIWRLACSLINNRVVKHPKQNVKFVYFTKIIKAI